MAQGVSAVLSNQFGNIVTANGTSFSGLSWLVWLLLLAGIPTKTNKEIRALIIQSADRYTTPTAQYGYGIPDFSAALTSTLCKVLIKIILWFIQIQLRIIFPFNFGKF
jgi:hypothetical protein